MAYPARPNGTHTGDYVTGNNGGQSGQLGPWASLISAIGIEPRGTGMKWVHVGLGVAWLAGVAMFLLKAAVGRWTLVGCSVLTLWYMPIGTVLSIVELMLLSRPSLTSFDKVKALRNILR